MAFEFSTLEGASHKTYCRSGEDTRLTNELYNVESLCRIGNLVGKTLKIDKTMAFAEKGGFSHVSVELDLNQPLLLDFMHFGEKYRFEYEGLHLIFFCCGKYGHHMSPCSVKGNSTSQNEESKDSPTTEEKLFRGDSDACPSTEEKACPRDTLCPAGH